MKNIYQCCRSVCWVDWWESIVTCHKTHPLVGWIKRSGSTGYHVVCRRAPISINMAFVKRAENRGTIAYSVDPLRLIHPTDIPLTALRWLRLILLTVLSSAATSAELAPFTSDGCSAFPDGTISQNELWLTCCLEHDRAYWLGGTYEQRQAADTELQTCVASLGEPEIAALMLAGVRAGGTPWLPTTFRWGYGWPWPRGYKPLSDEEQELANRMLPADSPH